MLFQNFIKKNNELFIYTNNTGFVDKVYKTFSSIVFSYNCSRVLIVFLYTAILFKI